MARYRLDKFLTLTTGMTRQEAKSAIKKRQVTINGIAAAKPEEKVDTDIHTICFNETVLQYEPYVYYMLNKPAGVVSATKDNLHKTVTQLFDEATAQKLVPVGRLDIDTEGLLLLTNDGALNHRLTSPAHHVEKTYFVRVNAPLTEAVITEFLNGLDIGEEKRTRPAALQLLKDAPNEALVSISEGKFHQIKRMFQVCGYQVEYLKRLKMGPLTLDEKLACGEYRRLTDEEIKSLKALLPQSNNSSKG